MVASSLNRLPRRGRGRPTVADSAAINDSIIMVSREVFFELGFGNATMEEVALRARMSKETLYARYSTKAELFEAVVNTTLQAWRTGANGTRPTPEPRTLEEAMRFHVAHQLLASQSDDFSELIRMLYAEAGRFPELTSKFEELVGEDRIKPIADDIRKFAEIDSVPCRDPDSAAEALRSLVAGWLQQAMFTRKQLNARQSKQLEDRVVEIFLASRPVW